MQAPILKQFIPYVFSLAITSLCLFLPSGNLYWSNAWLLLGLNAAASLVSMILLKNNPELDAERRNTKAGKSWDKPIVFVMVLLGPVATWITAGLDTRFHSSKTMGLLAVLAGVVIASLAIALVTWSMSSNRFFSAIVRIQKDRGHVVVSSGPYHFIRHPGYTGMALFTLVTPLILNSRWAFIPAGITAAVAVLRTTLEDRTLQNELDGYAEYTHQVRYRLVPLIW